MAPPLAPSETAPALIAPEVSGTPSGQTLMPRVVSIVRLELRPGERRQPRRQRVGSWLAQAT